MAEGILRIDVLIATCRRPEMLGALLRSLAAMPRRPDLEPRLVIVDNDPAGSARPVAEAFAAESPLPLTYALEPRAGVSQARNRALSLAQGDALAFVDDDQVVDPGWLGALVDAARRFGADVVFGPVLSVLPETAPAWIRKSGLFDRQRFPTGTPRKTGGAGNVLLSRQVLARAGRGFDEAFGRTGAEDTEFFLHLSSLGARLVWCDEALAWETVTPARATFAWLWRRNFMSGRLFGRIARPGLGPLGLLGEAARCLCGLAALSVMTPLALLAGVHVAARQLMRLARCLGRLAALGSGPETREAGA